ncbi:hypothetical protein KC957_00105 [Candidatus Saccharibacteria bacterium]|nr:hypothetical protein [Candidatus Saccharibacteria bacterium]
MRLCFLYHPASEHRRRVEDYARDFARRHGQSPELISLDTKAGAELAKLYDVVQYPALLVVDDNAGLSKYWQGDMLPLMDEVAGYLRA